MTGSRRPRVLLLLTSTAGGAGVHALQLARALPEMGIDLTVAYGRGYALDAEFEALPVPIVHMPLSRRPRPLLHARCLAKLVPWIRSGAFDLVVTSCSMAGLLGRLACALSGRRRPPLIHVLQVLASHAARGGPRRALYRGLERWLDRWTHGYVAVSASIERRIVELGITTPNKVRRIHNAAALGPSSPDARRAVRREWGLAESVPLIGTLCRFEPQKGLELFLATARSVTEQEPTARFVLVGDGPLRTELEEQVRRLELEGRVMFVGWRTDVVDVLAALDIVCLTSRWESFGIALAEAMLAGRAVVGVDVDGIPEVIGDEDAGRVVPRDSARLADALLELVRDPERARSLGARGRVRAMRLFGVQEMAQRYADLLHETLGIPPPPPGNEAGC